MGFLAAGIAELGASIFGGADLLGGLFGAGAAGAAETAGGITAADIAGTAAAGAGAGGLAAAAGGAETAGGLTAADVAGTAGLAAGGADLLAPGAGGTADLAGAGGAETAGGITSAGGAVAPAAAPAVGPASGAVTSPLGALQYGSDTTQLLAGGDSALLPAGATPAQFVPVTQTPNDIVGANFAALNTPDAGVGAAAGGPGAGAGGAGAIDQLPADPSLAGGGAVAPAAAPAPAAGAGGVDLTGTPAAAPAAAPATPATVPEASVSLLSKIGGAAKDYGWAAGLAPLAITMMRGEGKVPPQFGALEGQAGTLNAAGINDIQMAEANQLTAPQAAQIATTRETLVNQLRQQLYNSGQDPDNSTAFAEGMVGIESQLTAMTQTMISNTLTAGLQQTGQAAQDLIAAGNAQIQQDTAFTNALGAAAQALGTTVAVSTIAGAATKKAA